MVGTTVYLTVDQRKKLKKITKALGIPMSVLIRRGVDKAVDEGQEMIDKLASKG
jgi:hypothetical protein